MSQQKYDESFRRNAVQLVESGQSGAQVARDLGVPASQIYTWCAKYRRAASKHSTHGNASENQSEVAQLRKELSLARMELDILKKAITIFSQPEAPPNR
jgi:transposase